MRQTLARTCGVARSARTLGLIGALAAVGVINAGSLGRVSANVRCRATVIQTPRVKDAVLNAVAVAPDGRVWAVGSAGLDDTLILRWDGRRFTRLPSPRDTAEMTVNDLRDVVAPAVDAAWAVGGHLVLRWDGHSWSRSAAPDSNYSGVSASARTNVWVVGGGADVARWDGQRWERVPFSSPDASPSDGVTMFGYLEGVLTRSPNDVWVVGDGGAQDPVSAHWDGTAWRSYPIHASEALGRMGLLPDSTLGALAARGPHEVWAAGGVRGGAMAAFQWTGTSWRMRGIGYYFNGIAVRDRQEWTIRDSALAHWTGNKWETVERNQKDVLRDVAVDPKGDIWVVGNSVTGAGAAPLVRRYHCVNP